METKKQVIVPFRYGKGKTGNAQHGEERALIVETDNYPNAFNNLRSAIKDSVKHFPNAEEAAKKSLSWILTTGVSIKTSHVQEIEMGQYNLVFLNMQMLKGGPLRYLTGLTINGEHIKL